MRPDRDDLFSLFREEPWEDDAGPLSAGDWFAGVLFVLFFIVLLAISDPASAALVMRVG